MSNLIQNFEMEMLSKDEMKQLKGGVMVTCDVCYSDGECVGTITGMCPGSPSSCNGNSTGVGTTLQNCRIPYQQ